MDFVPMLTTFLLILVAELGDKTQLTVISLASTHRAREVFAGAILAFLVVDGVSLVIGGSLMAFLPITAIQVIAGAVFIFFGVLPLLRKAKESTHHLKKGVKFFVFSCFSLVSLMELGDKTQIVAITLAAEANPLLVLVGMMAAFAVLTGIGVTIGCKVLCRLPMKWINIGTSALFIILGAISIVGAVLGISIL
jgi:putative Ca2+/H+ antiporter (TMEM165/GDT1 family)